MKKKIFIVIMLFLPCSLLAGEEPGSIYYVRFDVKSVDNRMERSNLMIVPSDGEFRNKEFKHYQINGSADYRAPNSDGLDIQTRAAHSAIKNFLENNGLQSVKSQSTSVNGLAHDQTVVSYEGSIRLPYRVLESSFDRDRSIYSVRIDLIFAPLAFPDNWDKMLLKYRIRTVFEEFRSFF